MIITREIALKIFDEMAAEFARSFGYDQITYNDIDCGIWDMEHTIDTKNGKMVKVVVEKGAMSKWLQEKYGTMVEYKYHAKMPKTETFKATLTKGDYVGVRFMLGTPCISIHQDGNTYMGELSLSRKWLYNAKGEPVFDSFGCHERIDEYEVGGIHCLGERGIVWGNMLYQMWIGKVEKLKRSEKNDENAE